MDPYMGSNVTNIDEKPLRNSRGIIAWRPVPSFWKPAASRTAGRSFKWWKAWCCLKWKSELIDLSGQIIIIHQPRFSWNKGISLTKPPFGVRSCEVAITWPDLCLVAVSCGVQQPSKCFFCCLIDETLENLRESAFGERRWTKFGNPPFSFDFLAVKLLGCEDDWKTYGFSKVFFFCCWKDAGVFYTPAFFQEHRTKHEPLQNEVFQM